MPEQPPPLPPGAPHLLGPNETIKSISQLYGVPPEVLRAANPGLNMDRLRAGQTVKIPFALPSISPLAPAPSELRPQ
jgi:LysM repeat protein